MGMTSEPELGRAVMQVLAAQPNHEATVRALIKNVPSHITLTADDQAQSSTRPGEEMWEQRVRNLKSHDKANGNVIGAGFVRQVSRGTYRLTASGRKHMGLP
jgi:hypothetical protein